MKHPRFNLPIKPRGDNQRLDGLIRLMENIHKKSSNGQEFLKNIREKYRFLPPEVLNEIWKEEIDAMDRIRKQFRQKEGDIFDKASARDLTRIRGFMLKEQLRNTAIAILAHEKRKTN